MANLLNVHFFNIIRRPTSIVLLCFLLVILASPLHGQEANHPALLSLNFSNAQHGQRDIELLFSDRAPEPVSVFAIEAPARLIFEFDPIINTLDREPIAVDDGLVERMLMINHPDQDNASRLVVYMRQPAEVSVERDNMRLRVTLKGDAPKAGPHNPDATEAALPNVTPGAARNAAVATPDTPAVDCNPQEALCPCSANLSTGGAQGYTLQLLSARHHRSLAQWFQTNPGQNACYYRYQSDQGEQWYSVVSGHFNTRAAAQSAIDNLPAELQAASPWPISLRRLQSRITGVEY